MSLSSIKDLWEKIKKPDQINPSKTLSPEDFRLISDYMTQKFAESREIFTKFNSCIFCSVIKVSSLILIN